MSFGLIDQELHRRIGAELLETWDARQGVPFQPDRRRRGWSPQQLSVVHSLAAHTHRLYAPASRLLDDGWVIESMPLIRTAYECALTAQWVAQTSDGVAAFLNEDVRQRRSLNRTALEGVPASIRGDTQIPHIDLEPLETSAAGPARSFEQMCNDLRPGGASAYFAYRVLSMQTHPSTILVDGYLAVDEEGEVTSLRLDSDQPDAGPWLGILVSSLVWAGRAVDFFDARKVRRSQLRAAARDIGVECALQLSPAAQQRESRRNR